MCFTLLKRIKKDTDYRIKLFLVLTLVFNFAYAIFLFVVSLVYSSKWFFVMSIYYALLSTARIFIFSQIGFEKNQRKIIMIMRACGYFLFLLNLVVSVMMFILIYTTGYVKHHEITVITLATYTFSALALAIVSIVKYLKKNDYIYSCVKMMSLISASVSLVTLTNTMLTTFGEEKILLRSIVLPILSGVVAIFIIVCAVLLIIKASLDLRILKNEEK